MFRATSYILTVRTLFYRRHPSDFQIASISRFPTSFKYKNPREREPCPLPPPPPPPPPKDDSLFWGAVTILFLAGGLCVYARGSPEIRDWLTINAPWFDDLIAVLFQENMTYGEFAITCIEDTKKFIASLTADEKPKKCSLDGTPILNYDVPNESEVAPKEEEEEENALTCEPSPPPVVTQDICEIDKCINDYGEEVLNNYNTARDACAYYNALVEETMQKFSFAGMKALRNAMEERKKLIEVSLANASCATSKLDEMVRYLDCGVQASKDQIENSKAINRDFHDRFKVAFMEYQWENDRSIVLDAQWQTVEEVVDKYTSENEGMFPGLKYSAKKPVINGDLDVLLYNSYRYIHQLNGELQDTAEAMTERINRALDMLPKEEDALKARGAALDAAIKRRRGEVDAEFKRREDDMKADNDRILKNLTKKQMDKHEDTLNARLEQMEEEISAKFDGMVADKVDAEKRMFAVQLEEMALKLSKLEAKLDARMKAERETRRSQELWTAGASLLEATKKGDPIVKVDKELKAIEKASGGKDKLVTTVLKSIPPHVRESGVVPESVLREGFISMEKVARSVALVEQDGARMPVYILSWLQGLLLFMKVSGIPQQEFDKPPEEPPKHLDTFDLLQRAKFWMDQGNLANAVRHISSLRGASRAAAQKWYEAASAHLEVRQAAEAVLAHAAAMGLQYI
ncbi:MICOS complex subunit Mic60-like [Trichoplusia ni]|uniref:MICOS complex subunit MIC60 n=1 Tax=Trichoplusia ni TaxID=7111 RepID=A0A7E5VKY2_TRINI|nr:MICOS complex subunit Mic60-like [Trichoplusia ni]